MADAHRLLCTPSPRTVRAHAGATFSLEPLWPPREEEPGHSLDACFRCRRPLRESSDVFMYRGDTPFCSEECRQEQIELDKGREWEIRYERKRRRHHRRRRTSPSEQPAEVRGFRAPQAAVVG